MPSNDRIYGLDFVRSAAIFLVVLQHGWSMLDLNLQDGGMQHHVYSSIIYGVALFIMLSGALNLRAATPTLPFYRKRFARILPPFLLWGTVTYIISALLGKYSCVNDIPSGIKMYLPFLATGRINDAYWYIYLISALYLITPLIQRVLCGDGKIQKFTLAAIILIWLATESFTSIPGVPGTLFLYFGYYVSGLFFLKYVIHRNRRLTLAAGCLGFAVFFPLNVYLHSAGHPAFIAECGEVFSMFAVLSGINCQSRIIERISRYSFFIYLTHFILIGALYSLLPGVFPAAWYTPVCTAVLVISAEYLLCLILDRIKWLPKKFIGI